MGRNYLTEAFKEMELLESKSFGLDKQGLEGLDSFLDTDELKDIETIIDPEAMTEDDLEASYIGKVILGCDVCHSMIYKAPEEIIIDEESQMANVGELCPYCFTGDGYKVVGKVAPYKDITVEASGAVDAKVDGKTIKSNEEEVVEESLEKDQKYPVKSPIAEGVADTLRSRRRSSKIFTKESINNNNDDETLDEEIEKDQKYPVKSPIAEGIESSNNIKEGQRYSLGDAREFRVTATYNPSNTNREDRELELSEILPETDEDGNEYGEIITLKFSDFQNKLKSGDYKFLGESLKVEEDLSNKEKLLRAFPELNFDEPVTENIDEENEDTLDEEIQEDQKYPVKSPISESMEDISITTEDTVIKVKATPRADKETIEPVTEEEVVDAQVDAAFSSEDEGTTDTDVNADEEEVEMDEIDEEGMDELGEAYLKQVYENVNSFKTSKATLRKDKMIIEGVIAFNSGKKAKTQFLFEAKEMTKKGKLKFLGENKNLSKNKKAFTLTGSMSGSKLMVESLNYNYSGIDSKTGKAKRLYGTVKTKNI